MELFPGSISARVIFDPMTGISKGYLSVCMLIDDIMYVCITILCSQAHTYIHTHTLRQIIRRADRAPPHFLELDWYSTLSPVNLAIY